MTTKQTKQTKRIKQTKKPSRATSNKPRKPASTAGLVTVDTPELLAHVEAIRQLGKQTITGVIEIGHHLTEAKKLVPGGFGAWLKAEFDWHENTALNFMRVFEMSKSTNFVDLTLPLSSLYLLSAPSTPEAVREKVIESASKGEKVKNEAVVAAVKAAKKPAKPESNKPEVNKPKAKKKKKEPLADCPVCHGAGTVIESIPGTECGYGEEKYPLPCPCTARMNQKPDAELYQELQEKRAGWDLRRERAQQQAQPNADAAVEATTSEPDDGGAKVRELQRLNGALSSEVEDLKEEVARLKAEIEVKDAEIARLRGMAPIPIADPTERAERARANRAAETRRAAAQREALWQEQCREAGMVPTPASEPEQTKPTEQAATAQDDGLGLPEYLLVGNRKKSELRA